MHAKRQNDDLTTNQASAGHRATNSKSSTESPPTPGPLRAIGRGGEVLPLNYFNPLPPRTAYGPRGRVQITFPTQGRTKQSFRDECDINQIVGRFMRTGILDHVRQDVGAYRDVTGADYHHAMNLVAGANSMFFGLPSEIRSRFENNPQEFLEFMENPANAPEAVKMGLLEAQEDSGYPPTGASGTVASAASNGLPEALPKGEDKTPTAPKAPAHTIT